MPRPRFYIDRMERLPNCRVQAEHVKRLRDMAEELGTSVSELTRLAIKELIENPKAIHAEERR